MDNMFIAVQVIIASNVETIQVPTTTERINKLWYIHKMKKSTAMKRNDLQLHATNGWISQK